MAGQSTESTPQEAPTVSSSEEKPSGNWWETWISSAKNKSAEVYSMVKKDLNEIGTAVKSEASHVFSTTSNVLGKTLKLDEPESTANVMKKSLSTFIGQVSTVLNPEPDDEDDTEVILSSGDTTMLSTYKKELEALQRVDATFIVPTDSAEFAAWRSTLELSDQGVISNSTAVKRLDSYPVLKSQYEKLVPDAVSHDDFWERYQFRVALLQDKLAAAARRLPTEESTTDPVMANLPLQSTVAPIIDQSPKSVLSGLEDENFESSKDNIIVFGEDDFPQDVELTEEQQILLLEEYEKEIASKKISKQTSSRDITNNNTDSKSTNTDTPKNKKQIDKNKAQIDKNKTPIDKTKTPPRDNQNNKPSPVKKNKNGRSPKNAGKSDVCGNNLVEDYFGKEKDDADNSDESWEKEFEFDELQQKAID